MFAREQLIEAMLAARFRDTPGQWPDAFSVGLAEIERLLAARMLDAIEAHFAEQSRTIPEQPKERN